jgi:LacI family transcriptional regulator
MIPPSGITVRESTDVLATIEPAVTNALRFMWDNIAKDLSVDDIAEHVGLHRRKLERAFRRELKRGVNAELHRRRLEKSCELLAKTDLPVSDVSHMVGFRADDYFYRAFRRTFGATPLQWRKAHQ